MLPYTYIIYSQYGPLIKEYFTDLKSIFKNERYDGKYEIYLPHHFKDKYNFAVIPINSVAVLYVTFIYDGLGGNQELHKFCHLDASGYRIPDNSIRQFNEKVDVWLERIYQLREKNV